MTGSPEIAGRMMRIFDLRLASPTISMLGTVLPALVTRQSFGAVEV